MVILRIYLWNVGYYIVLKDIIVEICIRLYYVPIENNLECVHHVYIETMHNKHIINIIIRIIFWDIP